MLLDLFTSEATLVLHVTQHHLHGMLVGSLTLTSIEILRRLRDLS